MPTTKSAERRMRSSARRHSRNQGVKHRLKTLERRFQDAVDGGQKGEAATALSQMSSALDKAAKTGVIHRAKADRKKSRLAAHLNRVA